MSVVLDVTGYGYGSAALLSVRPYAYPHVTRAAQTKDDFRRYGTSATLLVSDAGRGLLLTSLFSTG